MEITPLGDSALILRVAGRRFEDAPERTLNQVLDAKHRIENAHIPGVIECAPAYTTVAIFFDPIEVIRKGAEPEGVVEWMSEQIRKALAPSWLLHRSAAHVRDAEIPVCFDPEFALDLAQVATHARRTPDEVVDLYCSPHYLVSCIGFRPGFPYLTGLPASLTTPRRSTPRKEVPAGSVAIGAGQTGIYPLRSPGGWNVIGRTPLQLFDPAKTPPAFLAAGDRVRFRPIGREEFEKLKR